MRFFGGVDVGSPDKLFPAEPQSSTTACAALRSIDRGQTMALDANFLTWILALVIAFAVGAFATRPPAVGRCPAPPDETHDEEDKHARARLTAPRLAKATPPEGGFDVVVIGAGPSGLVCAASLARLGKKVCVLEQGEELGGGAHVFALKGYEFETGVHYLGRDAEMERMLAFASHGRLAMADIGSPTTGSGGGVVYDTVVVGDEPPFEFVSGAAALRAMLCARFPGAEDGARIDRWRVRRASLSLSVTRGGVPRTHARRVTRRADHQARARRGVPHAGVQDGGGVVLPAQGRRVPADGPPRHPAARARRGVLAAVADDGGGAAARDRRRARGPARLGARARGLRLSCVDPAQCPSGADRDTTPGVPPNQSEKTPRNSKPQPI